MPFYHLTTRARYPLYPLVPRDHCVDLWRGLQSRFDRVQACVFMPNHLHLVGEFADPELARSLWVAELGAFTKRCLPGQRVWDPTGAPELLSTPLHVMRQIRYVHLNPCRARLAADPLEWEWSTHRDALGAAFPFWVDPAQLAGLMQRNLSAFPREFHSYVSGDPSVRVAGTALPVAADLAQIVSALPLIERAVLQAGRLPEHSLKQKGSIARRLCLCFAEQLGGRDQATLAAWLGISDRSLRELSGKPLTAPECATLRAASLILGNQLRFFAQPPKTGG